MGSFRGEDKLVYANLCSISGRGGFRPPLPDIGRYEVKLDGVSYIISKFWVKRFSCGIMTNVK